MSDERKVEEAGAQIEAALESGFFKSQHDWADNAIRTILAALEATEGNVKFWQELCGKTAKELDAAQTRIGELEKALAFYAKEENWHELTPPPDDLSGTTGVRCGRVNIQASAGKRLGPALVDWGKKARAYSTERPMPTFGKWKKIETAPKGKGERVGAPDYVDPPEILLLFENGKVSVGYWDWYYAEGGSGYEGGLAWFEPCSSERLDLHYDAPSHWMPLPEPPKDKP